MRFFYKKKKNIKEKTKVFLYKMSTNMSCCNETSTPQTTSVRSSSSLNIDPQEFHTVVIKLRTFFNLNPIKN